MNQEEKWSSYWESARKAMEIGQLEHAEPLLNAALDIAQDFPSEDRRLSMNLECLAEIHFRLNQLSQAEGIVKRIIAIYEGRYGPEHTDIGIFTNNLGLLYHRQKRYFMAESEYQKALSMQTKLLGSTHPQTLNVIANYARLLNETHREREAKHLEAGNGQKTGNWKRSGVYKAFVAEPSAAPSTTTDSMAAVAIENHEVNAEEKLKQKPEEKNEGRTTTSVIFDTAEHEENDLFPRLTEAKNGPGPLRSTRKNYRNSREEDITLQDALSVSPVSGAITSPQNPAVNPEKTPNKGTLMQRLLQQRRSAD